MPHHVKFFPFMLYAPSSSGGVAGNLSAEWQKVRPKDVTWYCVNVEVQSPTRVLFICFDMASNLYGGRGKEIGAWPATLEPGALSRVLSARAHSLARKQRKDELEQQEEAIVSAYAYTLLHTALSESP